MNELKPCPFCGTEARLYANNCGIRVICPNCKCQTMALSDMLSGDKMAGNATKTVIEKWNRRVVDVD